MAISGALVVSDRSPAWLRIWRTTASCWFLLAALLILGGVLGPDSLGEAHGNYLPQRIVLLGLVALVPIFDIDLSRLVGPRLRGGTGCRGRASVGHRLGLCALLRPHRGPDDPRPRRGRQRPEDRRRSGFDPKPVSSQSLAARRRLARESIPATSSGTTTRRCITTSRCNFDRESTGPIPTTSSGSRSTRIPPRRPHEAGAWEKILAQHAESIDVVVVWKSDPALDAITARWFDRVERRGDIQIFRRGYRGRIDSIVRTSRGTADIRPEHQDGTIAFCSGSNLRCTRSSSIQSFFFSFLSSKR